MKYQLVLQFRGDSLADYDTMIALEERLIRDLGVSAKLDGHDCGSGQTNIFIFTSDPAATFWRVRHVMNASFPYVYWDAMCQKVDSTGHLQDPPWIYHRQYALAQGLSYSNRSPALVSYPSDIGPVLTFASNRFLALVYLEYFSSTYGLFLAEDNEIPSRLQNFRLAQNGNLGVDLVGDINRRYSLEASTDFVNWSLVPMESNIHWPGQTIYFPQPPRPGTGVVYRAVSGGSGCVANLRRIRQAKDEWALDRDTIQTDSAGDNDLFGPGKYLPAKPRCPMGGTYTVDIMRYRPGCSLAIVAGHTL